MLTLISNLAVRPNGCLICQQQLTGIIAQLLAESCHCRTLIGDKGPRHLTGRPFVTGTARHAQPGMLFAVCNWSAICVTHILESASVMPWLCLGYALAMCHKQPTDNQSNRTGVLYPRDAESLAEDFAGHVAKVAIFV